MIAEILRSREQYRLHARWWAWLPIPGCAWVGEIVYGAQFIGRPPRYGAASVAECGCAGPLPHDYTYWFGARTEGLCRNTTGRMVE